MRPFDRMARRQHWSRGVLRAEEIEDILDREEREHNERERAAAFRSPWPEQHADSRPRASGDSITSRSDAMFFEGRGFRTDSARETRTDAWLDVPAAIALFREQAASCRERGRHDRAAWIERQIARLERGEEL